MTIDKAIKMTFKNKAMVMCTFGLFRFVQHHTLSDSVHMCCMDMCKCRFKELHMMSQLILHSMHV